MTQSPRKFIPPPRNPLTHAAHKREVFWQITVPLVLCTLVCVGMTALVVWSAAVGNPEVSRWADVSLIWLSPPIVIGSLVMLVLVGGLAFGIFKLIQVLPPYARLVQDFFLRLHVRVRQVCDRAVKPFIQAGGASAAARELRRQVVTLGRRSKSS